jgi:hypothetical protein
MKQLGSVTSVGLCAALAAWGTVGCGAVTDPSSRGENETAVISQADSSQEHEDDECELPESSGKKPKTLAVYGDAPYGTNPTDTSQTQATPGFIAAVNADPSVSLVVHVGDIHSGKQYCTEAYDRQVFDLWRGFADPLVYTPGDNEWTDCHKTGEGGGAYNKTTGVIDYVLDGSGQPVDYAGGDPLANLALVRSIFFAHPGETLGAKKRVLSQASCASPANAADANYVENVMWSDAGVLFAALNLPGGSNNDNDIWYGAPSMSAAQSQEIAQRTAADLRWLDRAFKFAERGKFAGLVLILQADMWDPEKGAAHQAAYEPFVARIARGALDVGKPVLMLNGDSHVYQSSNPLAAGDPAQAIHPGYDVPNFHRVVVHGSTTPLEYLRLTVDAKANAPHGTEAYGPFSWSRVME